MSDDVHSIPQSGRTPEGSESRFVWPPKRAVPEATRSDPPFANAEPATLVTRRSAADPNSAGAALDTPGRAPHTPATPRALGWLSEIERTWLGVVAPPWEERIADAGWEPDDLADFCPGCGHSVGRFELSSQDEGRAAGCHRCGSMRVYWDRIIRLGGFEGTLRDAIHEVKFEGWQSLGRTLGRSLGEQVRRALETTPGCEGVMGRGEELMLVPMPTTFRRRMSRGIDHTLAIARGVREVIGGEICRPIKREHRPSQVDLAPSLRLRNVAGAFSRRGARAIRPGSLVVVIDDVLTTGATMSAACRALRSILPRASGNVDKEEGDGGLLVRGQTARPLMPARIWAAVVAVTPEQRVNSK